MFRQTPRSHFFTTLSVLALAVALALGAALPVRAGGGVCALALGPGGQAAGAGGAPPAACPGRTDGPAAAFPRR
jgi:hypothetical protein